MSLHAIVPNNAVAPDAETIATRLRALADRIEHGELLVERVIVILDTPIGMDTRAYGPRMSNAELIGYLHYAMHYHMKGNT